MLFSGSAQPHLAGRVRAAGPEEPVPLPRPVLPCVPRDGPCATASPRPGAPVRQIHQIQGAGHLSRLEGERVSHVAGVVTAVTKTGFWLQDPRPDRDPATSDALFVTTGSRPDVQTGDAAWADGEVTESRPAGPLGLARTEIDASALGVTAHDRPLPAPVAIGPRGRRPPGQVIDDDARGNLESSGRFEPRTDGADFYEALEGMRVTVEDAVASGPTDPSGMIPVLSGDGDGAGSRFRTRAHGIVLRPGDPNPERVFLDDTLATTPAVDTGDRFPDPVTGVLDYGDGNYAVLPARTPKVEAAGPAPESASAPAPDEVSVATLNVQNLDPTDPQTKFAALARQITERLSSPDLIAVQEVQDNSGPEDDGTVSADQTVAELINAISAAGGPPYYWRSVDPRNNADGGPPGGNVRVGFLYQTERGLDLVHRPGAGPSTATGVARDGDGRARLTLSPGRIAPADPAFTDSRKPLAGEFRWRDRRLIVVANHWSATGLDDPLYGRRQPPRRPSAAQHRRESDAIGRFVRSVRGLDRNAAIIVAGDLNTADHTVPLRRLERTGLHNAARRLPFADRYTQVDEGNAAATDHILLSGSLVPWLDEVDVVHANADYAQRPTDRDPVLVRLRPYPGPHPGGHVRERVRLRFPVRR